MLAQGAAVAPIFRVSHRLRPSGRVSSARTPAYPYFCSGCVQPNDGKPPELRPGQVLEMRVQRNIPRWRGRLNRAVAFFKRYLLVRFPMDSGGDTDSGRSVYWYSGVNIIHGYHHVSRLCRCTGAATIGSFQRLSHSTQSPSSPNSAMRPHAAQRCAGRWSSHGR